MKKLTLALLAGGLMLSSAAAFAESPDREMMDKLNKMTPEQREAFEKDRKQKWDAMSKEAKLKSIEEHRKDHIQKMDDKWKNMSDDEKIKHVEERINQKGRPGGPDNMPPPENNMGK